MAYNEVLAARVREALDDRNDVVEKKMFGGLAFMVAGNMACGVLGDDLMARVGPERFEEALARPHTRPMDFTGKPSRGMVYVEPLAIRTASTLAKWVAMCVGFAASAPKRAKRAPKRVAAAAKRAAAKRAPKKVKKVARGRA